MFEGLNIFKIIVSAVTDMLIGSLWYSPLLLGSLWMQEMGMKKFDMKAAQKSIIMQAVNALVMATILYVILDMMKVDSTDQALEVTFLLWLGFVATTNLVRVIFEKQKLTLYVISVSYQLISLMVMAIIITSWK